MIGAAEMAQRAGMARDLCPAPAAAGVATSGASPGTVGARRFGVIGRVLGWGGGGIQNDPISPQRT
jgi:hypothetical protein